MIDSNAHPPGSFGDPGDGSPGALSWLLEAVRAAAADTGHPATQHALDAALVALEDALVRLTTPRASTPGGAA